MWAAALAASGAEPLYGRRICVETNAPAPVRAAADELAGWLGKATGVPFERVESAARAGIFLLAADSPLAPPAAADLRAVDSREAFLLFARKDRLYIVSATPRGIRNGVYAYLEELGFRWYFPTDTWTIVPKLDRIDLRVRRVSVPAFRMRQMAGTGGFGGSLVLDPDRAKQARWTVWLQRIRMDGEAAISGHAGEAFNTAHKQELTAHPEYLAEIGGARQPWGEITKPCYSNPGLIDLYVRDRVEAMRAALARGPDSDRAFAVSVEPADGGGHCECAGCRALGSVSDRVFSLANAAGRAVAAEFPGRRVSLLAYNEHAAVPRIAIESNVYVVVTPYGFNRTGLSAEELLAAWGAKKASDLGLYDYWAIPDWSHGLPEIDLAEMAAKVRLWHSNHVDGAAIESDHGIGSIGLAWYVASRLFWDPDADEGAVLDDFFARAFGEARVPMERMLARWGRGFCLTEAELGLSYRDILEARALARDPAVAARVNDFALYLHYLRLWYEFQFVPADPDSFYPPMRELLRYLWRIYPTDMTHSYRLAMLLLHRPTPAGGVVGEELRKEWGFYDRGASGWAATTPVAADEIDALMAGGARAYPVIEGVEPRRFSPELVPLEAVDPAAATNPALVETQPSGYPAVFEFSVPAGVGAVPFALSRGSSPGPVQRVTVTGPAGAPVLRREIAAAEGWQDIRVPTAIPGRYRMQVFDQKQMFRLRVPAWLPFVLKDGFMSGSQSPRMYFYVPRGTTRVAFVCDSVTPVKVCGPDGVERPVTGRRLLRVEVPPGLDGQVWSMANIKTWSVVRMVNVPSVWSFSPDGLMVPNDARAD